MKKDGFTLIEVVLNLSIIMIIFSTLLSISRFGIKIIHDVKVQTCVYEIRDFLSYAKSACASRNCYGKIIIDYNNNLIKIRVKEKDGIIFNEEDIKIINLPENTLFITASEDKNLREKGMKELSISKDGKIETGYTISIFDYDSKEKYDISIGVGNDIITLKGKEIQ